MTYINACIPICVDEIKSTIMPPAKASHREERNVVLKNEIIKKGIKNIGLKYGNIAEKNIVENVAIINE